MIKASEVTEEWLKQVELKQVAKVPSIGNVVLKELVSHVDGRGEVTEYWSDGWAERSQLSDIAHVYHSATDYGITKCWHLHQTHTDQFVVTRGKLQVMLVDIREDSPTFGHVNSFIMGIQKPRMLLIPPMVLHGWKALSQPEVIVVNLQSHLYSPDDEFKLEWDCILKDAWHPING